MTTPTPDTRAHAHHNSFAAARYLIQSGFRCGVLETEPSMASCWCKSRSCAWALLLTTPGTQEGRTPPQALVQALGPGLALPQLGHHHQHTPRRTDGAPQASHPALPWSLLRQGCCPSPLCHTPTQTHGEGLLILLQLCTSFANNNNNVPRVIHQVR